MALVTVSSVQCARCSALHRLDAETFIRFTGALYVGVEGGIYGPDADDVFCVPCFHELITAITPRVTRPTVYRTEPR